MNTNELLNIVKNCLIDEWQQLPIPLDSERVLEMIDISLDNAKKQIDFKLSEYSKK